MVLKVINFFHAQFYHKKEISLKRLNVVFILLLNVRMLQHIRHINSMSRVSCSFELSMTFLQPLGKA